MHGFLSSLFGVAISLKQSVEALDTKIETWDPRIDQSMHDKMLLVFNHMDSQIVATNSDVMDGLSEQKIFLKGLSQDIFLINSKLNDLQTKLKQWGFEYRKKENSPVVESPKQAPSDELVDEITKGIYLIPFGVKRDTSPHVGSSPPQRHDFQVEEDKPEPS